MDIQGLFSQDLFASKATGAKEEEAEKPVSRQIAYYQNHQIVKKTRSHKQKTMATLNWGYEGSNGPDQWHKLYPIASGDHQSPIDIKTKGVNKDPSLGRLQITWNSGTCKEIINVGHSFHVNFEDKDNQSVVTGGPLTGSYRLRQFHFHWGPVDDRGSEHAVDGAKYASELHLVHWNSDKYSSIAEASDKPDGLAIVTVFLKVGPPNEKLQEIVKALGAVKTKGKQAPFTNFDPSTLLPKSMDYWTYNGSLTHPPLYESVIWIIFKEPITISSEQLAQFRSILSSAEGETPCPILTNHRLCQPLKGRVVRT